VFPEYVAYLAAQRIEEAVARSALPSAPMQLADESRESAARLGGLRTWLGADLRRLADRLEPAPPRSVPAAAQRR
jgi:hypothetical protein